jgi:hypothetical protein
VASCYLCGGKVLEQMKARLLREANVEDERVGRVEPGQIERFGAASGTCNQD